VDAAGNVSSVMSELYNVVIVPSTTSITVHLVDGWNLVSTPFAAPTTAFTNCTMFLKWNGASWVTVTSLDPGEGYLVLHTGVEDVMISGTPIDSLTISAIGSYQLIGNPFEVPVLWSSITGHELITMALKWDGSAWASVNLSTDSMQPGVGYLILTSDVGNLVSRGLDIYLNSGGR